MHSRARHLPADARSPPPPLIDRLGRGVAPPPVPPPSLAASAEGSAAAAESAAPGLGSVGRGAWVGQNGRGRDDWAALRDRGTGFTHPPKSRHGHGQRAHHGRRRARALSPRALPCFGDVASPFFVRNSSFFATHICFLQYDELPPKAGLVERFNIDDTNWEGLSSFLGVNVHYDLRAGRLEMDVEQKVEKLLAEHPLLHNIRMHDVPVSDSASEVPESAASKYTETDIYIKNNYASIIGSCIYMSITVRSDITFAVGKCARGMHYA